MHPILSQLTRHPTRRWAHALWFTLAVIGCGGGVESGGTGAAPVSFASGPITGFGSVIVNGVRFDDSSAGLIITRDGDDAGTTRSRDDLRLGMTTEIRGSAIAVDAVTGASISTASSIAFASDLLGRVVSVDLAGKRLVVLGQTVEVSATTVFDDATLSGGLAALVVGDVVEVYALFDAATGHYRATRIERKGAVAAFRLRGPVSNLDTGAKTFNIGTERISYLGLTAPASATPVNGAFLRVRLQPTPIGGVWLVAALSDGVQRPRDLDEVRLEGLVSAFTSTAQFSVNGVAVDARAITPPAGLALGARVEVEGTASGGVLVASKVKVKSMDEVDRQEFELRDRITSVNLPAQTFVIRGVTVRYSLVAPATDFRNGTVVNLAAGASVEVRGVLSPDGSRLLAARITFR